MNVVNASLLEKRMKQMKHHFKSVDRVIINNGYINNAYYTCSINCQATNGIECSVSHKWLIKVIKAFKNDNIYFQMDGKKLSIKSHSRQFSVKNEASEKLSDKGMLDLISASNERVHLTKGDIALMKRSKKFVTKGGSRPQMTVTLLSKCGDVVASNGAQMFYKSFRKSLENDYMTQIVPFEECIMEKMKHVKSVAFPTSYVKYTYSNGDCEIDIEPDINYPDYKRVIPKGAMKYVSCSQKELKEALEFILVSDNYVKLSSNEESEGLKITGVTVGGADDDNEATIPKIKGEGSNDMVFTLSLLLEVVKDIDTDNVDFSFYGDNAVINDSYLQMKACFNN